MRILIINNLFPPDFIGGYELMASEVAKGFASHGHDVLVATCPLMTVLRPELNSKFGVARVLQGVSLSLEPYRQDRFSYGGCVNLINLNALNSLLIEFKPDSTYCMNLSGLGSAGIVWFLIKSGYTPIVHLGDDIFAQWAPEDRDQFSRFSSYFGLDGFVDKVSWIAVAEGVLREASGSLGMEIPKATFIPSWNYHKHDDGKSPIEYKNDGNTKFVFSSRIAPHKGIHLVLEAARELLNRGETRFTIDLYGGGEVAEWRQRSSALYLDSHVFFRGTVAKEEMTAAFARYDALLLPTWERDPCPTVVGEAATLGCIPIFTQEVGCSQWLLDGEDCIKIPREVPALVSAMLMVIDMDDETKYKFSERLSAKSRSLFHFDTWYPKLEEIAIRSRRALPLDAERQRRIFGATCALTRLWRE